MLVEVEGAEEEEAMGVAAGIAGFTGDDGLDLGFAVAAVDVGFIENDIDLQGF